MQHIICQQVQLNPIVLLDAPVEYCGSRGRKKMELLHDIIEGRYYGQLKDFISESHRSRWRQDSNWEFMSETCWKQQKTKEEEEEECRQTASVKSCDKNNRHFSKTWASLSLSCPGCFLANSLITSGVLNASLTAAWIAYTDNDINSTQQLVHVCSQLSVTYTILHY